MEKHGDNKHTMYLLQKIPKSHTAYYNFRTNKYDWLNETPDDWSDYISQSPAAQSLYRLLIDHLQYSPIEAALHVLEKSVGSNLPHEEM